MTDRVDLQAARVLCNNATQGPWIVAQEIDGMRAIRWTVVKAGYKRVVTVDQTRPHHDALAEHNIEFIAAARTLVPALLDEIERLREERGRLVKATNQLAQVRLLCHEMNRRGISSGWPFTVTAILELTADDE